MSLVIAIFNDSISEAKDSYIFSNSSTEASSDAVESFLFDGEADFCSFVTLLAAVDVDECLDDEEEDDDVS